MTCCSLSHNGARYGGGVYLNYGGTLNSCVLSENAAIMDSGGADLDHGGTLNNCTVTKNSAGIYGGGSRLVLGGEINNCIVYANKAQGVTVSGFPDAPLVNVMELAEIKSIPQLLTPSMSGSITVPSVV